MTEEKKKEEKYKRLLYTITQEWLDSKAIQHLTSPWLVSYVSEIRWFYARKEVIEGGKVAFEAHNMFYS